MDTDLQLVIICLMMEQMFYWDCIREKDSFYIKLFKRCHLVSKFWNKTFSVSIPLLKKVFRANISCDDSEDIMLNNENEINKICDFPKIGIFRVFLLKCALQKGIDISYFVEQCIEYECYALFLQTNYILNESLFFKRFDQWSVLLLKDKKITNNSIIRLVQCNYRISCYDEWSGDGINPLMYILKVIAGQLEYSIESMSAFEHVLYKIILARGRNPKFDWLYLPIKILKCMAERDWVLSNLLNIIQKKTLNWFVSKRCKLEHHEYHDCREAGEDQFGYYRQGSICDLENVFVTSAGLVTEILKIYFQCIVDGINVDKIIEDIEKIYRLSDATVIKNILVDAKSFKSMYLTEIVTSIVCKYSNIHNISMINQHKDENDKNTDNIYCLPSIRKHDFSSNFC